MDIESCSISTSVDVEKNEKALTFAAPHRFDEDCISMIRLTIHEACELGDLQQLGLILHVDCGSIEEKAEDSMSPLHTAAAKGQHLAVQMLIEKGANVEAVSITSSTPLHYAACLGNVEVAKALIEGGANLNAVNQDGFTPLHWAAFHGHAALAQLLIDSGASIIAEDQYGDTPLVYAERRFRTEVVEVLEKAFVNVRQRIIFIIHNKADAGEHAKKLKALLVERMRKSHGLTQQHVVIDTDLASLGQISANIALSSNIIILLSKNIFSNPHCVLEISASSHGQKNMLLLETETLAPSECSSALELLKEQLGLPTSKISKQLSSQGVSGGKVKESVDALLEIPPINIELLFLEGQEHPDLIGNIVSMCGIHKNITPVLNQVYCTAM